MDLRSQGSRGLRKLNTLKKLISTSVALCLFTTQIIFPSFQTAWAHPSIGVDHKHGSNAVVHPINIEGMNVPSALGVMEETFHAENEAFKVLFIQDAHGIPEAQRSLADLIMHLQDQYEIPVVAVEGSDRSFDAELFHSFPDHEELSKVIQGFLNAGELSGAVAAHLIRGEKSQLVGIENWELYEEGLETFQTALATESFLQHELQLYRDNLEAQKTKVYSSAALLLDQKINAWQESHDAINELLLLLSEQTQLNADQYPNTTAVLKNIQQESLKTNADLDNEITQLAEELQSHLQTKESRLRFNGGRQSFLTGEMSRGAFAELLSDLMGHFAKEPNLYHPLSDQLQELIQNQKKMQAIRGQHFLKEFQNYLEDVQSKLLQSKEAQLIHRQSKALRLLEKLTRLQLSLNEWKAYQETDWHGQYPAFERFYEITELRDIAFIKNIKKIAKDSGAQTLILVAGGFHVEAMKNAFKENHISYGLITPSINTMPEATPYAALMRGDVSWKAYYEVKDNKIDLHHAFSRAFAERLPINQAKQWRDQLIRNLSIKGRVSEAAKYTVYIDELSLNGWSREKSEALKAEWTAKFESFLSRLDVLHKNQNLDHQSLLAAFKQPVNQMPAVAVPSGILSASLVTGSPRAEVRTLSRGEQFQAIYYGDNAETISIRSALANYYPPTAWLDDYDDSQLKPLTIFQNTRRPASSQNIVALYDSISQHLYAPAADADLRFTAPQKYALHARFIENVFLRLAQKYPYTVIYSRLADLISPHKNSGYSQATLSAIGTAGLFKGDGFYHSTNIPWDTAVILARDAYDLHGNLADWKVLKAGFEDESLSEEQIDRIWGPVRRVTRETTSEEESGALSTVRVISQREQFAANYYRGYSNHTSLRTALQTPVPPTAWLDDVNPDNLKPLWIDLGSSERQRRAGLKALYEQTSQTLFGSDEALDSIEKRVIQARFLENVFHKLSRMYSEDKIVATLSDLITAEKGSGGSSNTVLWWGNIGLFQADGNYLGATIEWDSAVILAQHAYGVDRRTKAWDYEAIRQGFDNRLTDEQIERIWTRAVPAGVQARAEVRVVEPVDFSNLSTVDWNFNAHRSTVRTLLLHLIKRVNQIERSQNRAAIEPSTLLQRTGLFKTPLINGQSLESLLNYAKDQALKRGIDSPVGLLLYEAGFRNYEGYKEIDLRIALEKDVTASSRQQFQQIKDSFEGRFSNWLDLFLTDHTGLIDLFSAKWPSIPPDELIRLISEEFRQFRKSKDDFSYPRANLVELEPDFKKFVNGDLQELMQQQIRHRITAELVDEALVDTARNEGESVTLHAIALARKSLNDRLDEDRSQGNALLTNESRQVYQLLDARYEQLQKLYNQLMTQTHEYPIRDTNPLDNDSPQELSMHQLEGILFGMETPKGFIGDEMGIGKSAELLGVIQAVESDRNLIVASGTVLEKWIGEIRRWVPGAQELDLTSVNWDEVDWEKEKAGEVEFDGNKNLIAVLRAGDIQGTHRLERLLYAKNRARFILINYEFMAQQQEYEWGGQTRPIREILADEINEWKPVMIAGDEAHRFRNPGTLETQLYTRLESERLLNLSGTLLVNRLDDLWALLNKINPEEFPHRNQFATQYQGVVGRVRLNLKLRKMGLIIRRTKEQVMTDLKTLHDTEFVDVPMGSADQFRVYQLFAEIYDADETHENRLGNLYRLRASAIDLDMLGLNPVGLQDRLDRVNIAIEAERQIKRTNPEHVINYEQILRDYDMTGRTAWGPQNPFGNAESNPNYPYAFEPSKRHQKIVEDAVAIIDDSEKAHRNLFLVSDYHHPLRRLHGMLAARIGEERISTLQKSGSDEPLDSTVERLAVVDAFNNPENGKRVILSPTRVGGEGLDIYGASYVFVADAPLTDAALQQAINRAHRRGQKYDVFSRVYASSGTWEMLTGWKILDEKRELGENVLDGLVNENFVEQSRTEEIHEAVREQLRMARVLARIQEIYLVAQRTGDWNRVRDMWNDYANEYSTFVPRLAAFPIAQLFLLYMISNIPLGKGDAIGFLPSGPATDLRAWHPLRDLFRQLDPANGFSMNDLDYRLYDVSEAMLALAEKSLNDLGVPAIFIPANLVEDELEPQQHRVSISSEIAQYESTRNSHGVAQRVWMVHQTINSTQVNGDIILWDHNGIYTEETANFLAANFPVTVVNRGTLNIPTAPGRRQNTIRKMSFIHLTRTSSAVPTLEALQAMAADSIEIQSGRKGSLTRSGVNVQTIRHYDDNPDDVRDASLERWIRESGSQDGGIQIEERVPPERTGDELSIIKLREEIMSLLQDSAPRAETVDLLEEKVQQFIRLLPKAQLLLGIYNRIESAVRSERSPWAPFLGKIEQDILAPLSNEIDDMQREGRILVEKVAGPRPAESDDDEGGGVTPLTEVPASLLADEDLLAYLVEQGVTFLIARPGSDHYSKNLTFDVKSRTVWVNSDILRNPHMHDDQKRELLNLLMHLHLDILMPQITGVGPQHRLEFIYAGLDRLQKRFQELKDSGRDFDLLRTIDYENNASLFFFVMELRDLPNLSGSPTNFQPGGRETREEFAAFTEKNRREGKNVKPIQYSKALDRDAVRRIEEFLARHSLSSVSEDTKSPDIDVASWIEDFRKRHGDLSPEGRFRHLKASDIRVNIESSLFDPKEPELQILSGENRIASLKPSSIRNNTPEPWFIKWSNAKFPEWAGEYVQTKLLGNFSVVMGDITIPMPQRLSAEHLDQIFRPGHENEDGLLLVPEKAADGAPLLLKRITANEIGVFKLDSGLNLDLSAASPVTAFKLVGGPGFRTVKDVVDHTMIKLEADAATGTDSIVFYRYEELGSGTSQIFQIQFKPALDKETRSEVRQIVEIAVELHPLDVLQTSILVESAARLITRFGYPVFRNQIRSVFEAMVRDEISVRRAYAASRRTAVQKSYQVMETALRTNNLDYSLVANLGQREFRQGLDALGQAITQQKVDRLAPVIFYQPGMDEQLKEFIDRVYTAVDTQSDLSLDQFQIHLVFDDKTDLRTFVSQLAEYNIRAQNIVHYYSLDGSAAALKRLDQALQNRVYRHAVFQSAYGVFFPPQSYLDIAAEEEDRRRVQSEIDAVYGMALVPQLSLYFARSETREITGVTLREALPQFIAGIQFDLKKGITIVAEFLQVLVQAEVRIAASA